MSHILESYLDRVMTYANLSPAQAADVRSELRDHLLKKVDDLQTGGASHEDAVYRAIQAHGHPRVVGYGLRPRLPWLDVRTQGTARGVIAVGPAAVGVVAIGGAACGVVAVGGMAAGVVAMGGLSVALVFAFCGVGLATVAYGGMVAGVVALGGGAAGLVAVGGFAVGLLADGGMFYSAFSAADAPEFLIALARWTEATVGWTWLPPLLVAAMMTLLAASGILSYRERRRLQTADPWIQE